MLAAALAGLILAAGAWPASSTEVRSGANAATRQPTRSVLILYSLSRMQAAVVEGDRGFNRTIRTTVDRPALVFDEALDAPRFGGAVFEATVLTYLRDKYASRRPDVLVAVGEQAFTFLLRHRDELWRGTPVVHAGVPVAVVRSLPAVPAEVVGVPIRLDFAPTLELALRWHPRAGRLLLVTGSTDVDRALEAQLRAEARRLEGRVSVQFLAGLPMGELLSRLAQARHDEVVFTPGFYGDGAGQGFTPRHTVEAMAAVSRAPVYCAFSTHLGTGAVGGFMPSFEEMGRQAADIVNELLAGVPPAALRLPEVMPQVLHVDWRQVRRWGIEAGDFPAGAQTHYRAPTLLEAHRREVIVALVVIGFQTGLIAVLLVERRRRRRAEATTAAQRVELTHASRLALAGELTASIAHEVNQPLGAILANADAAELILDAGGDRSDELRAILADIRRDDSRASEVIRRLRALLARHEVERRRLDVNEVVREVEAMLGAEARRRATVIVARPSPTLAAVVGDRVQLQQVLINLVLNALDAVTVVPEECRAITVAVDTAGDRVTIAVRDRGPGIPPEHLGMVFDSFFTTKRDGMGLGLPIARSLVEAHGGTLRAGNGRDGGAEFQVEFPAARAQAAAEGAAR